MQNLEFTKEMATEVKSLLEQAVAEHCCGSFNGLGTTTTFNGVECEVIWTESDGLIVEQVELDENGDSVSFQGVELQYLQEQYHQIVDQAKEDIEADLLSRQETMADSYRF